MANKLMLLMVVLVVGVVINVASQDALSRDAKKTKETTDGTSNSRTGWAVTKLWKGLGLKNDDSVDDKFEEVEPSHQSPSGLAGSKETAYDKATEKAHLAKQAAYGTAEEATDKASSLKDGATEKVHEVTAKAKQFTEPASENGIKIKEKAKQAAEVASDTAGDLRDTVHGKAKEAKQDAKDKVDEWAEEGESTSWMKTKAKEGYDGVKERASKTLHNAKEMAKDMVAPQYDDDEL